MLTIILIISVRDNLESDPGVPYQRAALQVSPPEHPLIQVSKCIKVTSSHKIQKDAKLFVITSIISMFINATFQSCNRSLYQED